MTDARKTHPAFALQEAEDLVLEGEAARKSGTFGAKTGPLWLTSRRILWRETGLSAWPFKQSEREIELSEVRDVDKGGFIEWIFGGPRLCIRLKSGRSEKLFVTQWDRELDDFIAAIKARLDTPSP